MNKIATGINKGQSQFSLQNQLMIRVRHNQNNDKTAY